MNWWWFTDMCCVLRVKLEKCLCRGAPPVHVPPPPATEWSLNLKPCSATDKVVWGTSKPVFMFYYPLSQVSVCFLSFSMFKQMLLPIKHWLGWWCSCCNSRKMPLENMSPILPSQSFLWVSGLTRCFTAACFVLPPVSVLLVGFQVIGRAVLRLRFLLMHPLERVK